VTRPERVPPDRVPVFGQILTLAPGDWEYHDGTRHLTLMVARADLSHWYQGTKIWIEGWEVEHPDQHPPGHRMQILVRCAAIPAVHP
jgi:hypothetical protein